MPSIRSTVLRVLESMCAVRAIDISDRTQLGQLGLDSPRIVDLMIALADEFETLIDDSKINHPQAQVSELTVGELIKLFEDQVEL